MRLTTAQMRTADSTWGSLDRTHRAVGQAKRQAARPCPPRGQPDIGAWGDVFVGVCAQPVYSALFVSMRSRTGEDAIAFCGKSLFAGPDGSLTCQAGREEVTLRCAGMDLAERREGTSRAQPAGLLKIEENQNAEM